jgi:lipopolysaccharide transport system permease protein
LIALVRSLWRNRELVRELTRRDLFQGHASHILGGMWVLANPLITLLIYFLVFHFIFPTRVGGRSGEAFLLAGLVQWVVLSEVMVRACAVVRLNANMVKQISFPLEVLVAKAVLSGLFVQAVMSAGLLAVVAFQPGGIGPAALGLWLVAILLQAVFMLGIALILASLTPFVPDTAEVVGVVARLGLFVTPILYASNAFGPVVEALFHLNPFSYFAWIHQDALAEQAITHPWAWLVAAALALGALWLGERLFRQMSPAFTDVL